MGSKDWVAITVVLAPHCAMEDEDRVEELEKAGEDVTFCIPKFSIAMFARSSVDPDYQVAEDTQFVASLN